MVYELESRFGKLKRNKVFVEVGRAPGSFKTAIVKLRNKLGIGIQDLKCSASMSKEAWLRNFNDAEGSDVLSLLLFFPFFF